MLLQSTSFREEIKGGKNNQTKNPHHPVNKPEVLLMHSWMLLLLCVTTLPQKQQKRNYSQKKSTKKKLYIPTTFLLNQCSVVIRTLNFIIISTFSSGELHHHVHLPFVPYHSQTQHATGRRSMDEATPFICSVF